MDNPIRILHVIGSMNRGGAENMIMNYYRNIDRSKFQFDFVENILEPAAFDDEIRMLGGRIYNCPHYNGKNHFEYKKWWYEFFEEHSGDYKIIHGHLGSTAAIYLSIAKRFGIYTIAHCHSTGRTVTLHGLLYKLYSYPTRFVADKLLACSEEAGIARYGNKHGETAVVIENAIDTNKFGYCEETRRQLRSAYNIGDKLVVGHVGRFDEEKNHSFLIDIFEQIHKKNKASVLLLVGGGPLEDEVRDKAARLGLSDSVIFAGIQSSTADYYQEMDVFVLPSLYEGIPLVVIEAQSAGLPCVASDVVPEEAKVTDLIEFVPLKQSAACWAETVLNAACKYGLRRDYKSEVAASGYDIKSVAGKLSEIYSEIVSDGR